MDDLSAMLSQILGSEEGMAQLRNAAAQLGLTQDSQPPPQPRVQQQGGGGPQGGNTPDLSALASMLSGAMGGQGQNAPTPQGGGAQQGGNAPDLSALASMLSGAMGNQSAPSTPQAGGAPQGGGTPDLSALASMLSGAMGSQGQSAPAAAQGGGGPDLSSLASMLSGALGAQGGGGAPSPLQGIDMNTILTLQKAYQTFTARDKNTDLLLALKPHFNPERQKKVDDAIRILGLIKLLPLLKESGLMESLGGLLGGEAT